MAKVKSSLDKTSYQNAVIIDQLAKLMIHLGNTEDPPKKIQKLVAGEGVILKYFSKKNNFPLTTVERLVRENLFFELSTQTVLESFLFKQPKELTVASFTEIDKIGRLYKTNRERMVTDASVSDVLITRLMSVAELNAFDIPHVKVSGMVNDVDYVRPRWTLEKLYSTYLPDDFVKYKEEVKAQSNLEKRFNYKLPGENVFSFTNGMVANSLLSWFQSLLITDPEVVMEHLLSGDFERWLRKSVKERELANICSNLSRQFENSGVPALEVKREMMKRLRRTSFESSIYNSLTRPLLKKLRSPEPVTVSQAAEKLMELGDEKAVDGLIETLFESLPETRKVVMEALGVIGDPRAVPPLVKIVEHSRDQEDKIIAIWTLSKFDDDRAREFIKKTAEENQGKLSERAKEIIEKWKASKV